MSAPLPLPCPVVGNYSSIFAIGPQIYMSAWRIPGTEEPGGLLWGLTELDTTEVT